MKYVNVILFRIACYTIKIQNCPPKDIFKKFERKAHNHSTLVKSDGQKPDQYLIKLLIVHDKVYSNQLLFNN